MAELFKVNAPVRKPLFEGVQGENEARSIQFDITPWVDELGTGAVTATAKRSQDSQPYPVTITVDGTTATWKPTSTDTAYAGFGAFQLEYTVNSVLAKTCVWSTIVKPSLDPAGDPPDPYDNWLADLREIEASAIQAAEDAVNKIPYPVNPDSRFGTSGQLLRTKGDGNTEWSDVGLPTDEQTAQAITDWLDEHPEATTTVEDHSLTYEKLVNGTLGYVTPEMFGAKGDGVTDDTEAFANCFGSLVNGGCVYIGCKTYKLTDYISVLSGTFVLCNGTIEYDLPATNTNKGLFDFIGDNTHWNGGNIKGTGALTHYEDNSCVFHANDICNISIRNANIYDTPCIYGILFETCSYATMSNIQINEYTYGGIVLAEASKHAVIEKCKIINGNESTTGNRYPISANLYKSATTNMPLAEDIIIQGNYIEDEHPWWEGIDAHGGKNLKIINNTIINTLSGISCVGETNKFYCENINISGNTILFGSDTVSLSRNNVGICTQLVNNAVVSHNLVVGSGRKAPNLQAGSAVYISETNNSIYSCNDLLDCTKDAVYVTSGNSIKITSNHITGDLPDSPPENPSVLTIRSNSNQIYFEDNSVLNYLKSLNGNSSFNGGTRVYLKNNIYDKEVYFSNVSGAINDQMPASPADYNGIVGKKGDIVMNSNPSTGKPIGWVCTSSGTTESNAVWRPLPNLS